MMTIQEAIDYIENFTWSTSKMGLERTVELLARMGNPQKLPRFVHVTGSNGKGSTCSMVASVLTAAGLKTGMYISPHVCDFNERLQVNGQYITDDELAEITDYVSTIADAMEDHPSQFELVTAIGMEFFKRRGCDLVMLEVGMGGLLDSTNVIDAPLVAAFTNIGLEHTEYLGNTLEEIAITKGGIIKPGCFVVCYESEPEVVETLRKISSNQGATFTTAGRRQIESISTSLTGQKFRYQEQEYEIRLLGDHQLSNAAVALGIIDALRKKGVDIPEVAVKSGLAAARWPARFEVLKQEPLFILDGGHNPQCAEALVKALEQYLPGEKVTFLTGVLADKDYKLIVDLIAPFASRCICVSPPNPRALDASSYAEAFRQAGIEAEAYDSVAKGTEEALKEQGPVVAFGSLYMAGEIRAMVLGGSHD